ncbi:MAG: general secretion pathway protein GspK [Candidatus Omnitrophica bacterium]|nr:general secretion pathway protein GspK [Candidatus Omnitrophota bacterium]
MIKKFPLFTGLNPKRASILILTLWVLAFLGMFGLYLNQGIRQKLALVKNLSFRSNLHYIADAGVKRSIIQLVKDKTDFDCLNDVWSNNISVFEDMPVGLGKAVVYYEFTNPQGGKEERYGLIDEERKLNINTASRLNIENLIEVTTKIEEVQAQEIAAAIVDWRDADSELSIPLGSAEDSYYDSLEEPYNCKDDNFQVLEEVLLVKGMNDFIFERLKDFITIYGDGKVNINTAPLEVLMALEVDERIAEKLIEFRAGDDKTEGTSDDHFFQTIQEVVSELSAFANLSESEVACLERLVSLELITTSSMNYTVRVRAEIGQMSRKLVCVVNKKGRFVSWQEP